MNPKLGRSYRLRNGAIVDILRVAPFKPPFLIGRYKGTTQGYTCQMNGHYAPKCGIRPHELDIVKYAGIARRLRSDYTKENNL